MGRYMLTKNQVKNVVRDDLQINKVEDSETVQFTYDAPIMFNEPIYDYNGEEILGGQQGGGTTLYKHMISGTGMFESDEDVSYLFNFIVVLPFEDAVDGDYLYDLLVGNQYGIVLSGNVLVNEETEHIFIRGSGYQMFLLNPNTGNIGAWDLDSTEDVTDSVLIYA